MSMPTQNALKLPATMPERIVNDGPPSREAVTISWTCLECELVKILVNSGISTAAMVPQLMMEASCHQRLGSRISFTSRTLLGSVKSFTFTERSLRSNQLMPNEVEMHRIE